MSSINVHAAIITDSSERRIEVRQGSGDTSNAYISPSNNVSSQRPWCHYVKWRKCIKWR
ncbi:hypothetical protein [Psychrobacter sp. KH172YL61]|uniref:hypothetical protein n=1 Tax=Psychrobacter sp. KH172YL61 TaxID=2517899 RepID=UPI001F077113|nr:hypothetical protein [Psychrobacter sp. KH172YL61]